MHAALRPLSTDDGWIATSWFVASSRYVPAGSRPGWVPCYHPDAGGAVARRLSRQDGCISWTATGPRLLCTVQTRRASPPEHNAAYAHAQRDRFLLRVKELRSSCSPSGCRMAPCIARPLVSARRSAVVSSASAIDSSPPSAAKQPLPPPPAATAPASRAFSRPAASALRLDASCADSCAWMSAALRSARSLTKFSEHHRLRSLAPTCRWIRNNQHQRMDHQRFLEKDQRPDSEDACAAQHLAAIHSVRPDADAHLFDTECELI